MKLELKHKLAYLPYKVEVLAQTNVDDDDWVRHILDLEFIYEDWEFKLILRPLSDLDWKFCRDYDLQREKVKSYLEFGRITLKQYTSLLENHFDVFGLIEKGLAIDSNTLNTKTN